MDRRYKKRINRYWKKMEQRGSSSLSHLKFNEWFDYWHAHPDWEQKGNKCPENRYSAIEVGYKLLQVAESMCEGRLEPIQCWATVCENTGDNAIYLHTKNPNKTPYPHIFDNVEWESADYLVLTEIVDNKTHVIGKCIYPDQVIYFIQKRA